MSNNGSDRRDTFVIMTCGGSGKYIHLLWNFKRDNTRVQENVSVPLSCVVICWQIRNGYLMSYVVYITMTYVKS